MTNTLQNLANASGYTMDELLEHVPNNFCVRTKKGRAEVEYLMKHDCTLRYFKIKDFMECENVDNQFNVVFIEGDGEGDVFLADVVYANIAIKGRW